MNKQLSTVNEDSHIDDVNNYDANELDVIEGGNECEDLKTVDDTDDSSIVLSQIDDDGGFA